MAPTLLFFLAFFIAFSLLELILIFILNRLAAGHWVFFIDRIIRLELHHRRVLWGVAYLSLAGFALYLFYSTSLFSVLQAATLELRGLAAGLLGVMVLVYFLMTRRSTALAIQRRIQLYLYLIISLFFYTMIMLMADQMFGRYQEFVNSQLIDPAVRQVEHSVDRQKEEMLLNRFRLQAQTGKCTPVDYRTETSGGVKQFVFVTMDPALASPDFRDGMDISTELKGQACTDGENTFLLKRDGSWYWVIDVPEVAVP